MRAVLFDLDETLFDRTGSLRLFLADQHQRHEPLGRMKCARFVERFLELDRRGRGAKAMIYATILEELGAEDTALTVTLLEEYETKSRQFARAFPGMGETLTALRQRGLKLGIVTNGRTSIQTGTIEALKLNSMVDTILISEAEGIRKPNGEIFLRAANRLNIEPSLCLFVGDTPQADILGARAVGMKTAWFPNGAVWPDDLEEKHGPTIAKLEDLIAMVQD